MPFIPANPPPSSPRARDLARRLREVIDKFRSENPGTTDLEVRQAFRLVASDTQQIIRRAIIALAVGLALGLLAFLLFNRQAGNSF